MHCVIHFVWERKEKKKKKKKKKKEKEQKQKDNEEEEEEGGGEVLTFRADSAHISAAVPSRMAVMVTEAVGRVTGTVAGLTAVLIVIT